MKKNKNHVEKRSIIARLIGVLILGIAALFFISCENFFISMPSELIGTWRTGSDYVNQFKFTRTMLYYESWSATYPGQFESSYECELEDVLEDENMIYTDCHIYYAYHISGSTLYLYKTNYDDPKPELPDSWWTDGDIAKYTLSRAD